MGSRLAIICNKALIYVCFLSIIFDESLFLCIMSSHLGLMAPTLLRQWSRSTTKLK